MSPESTHVSVLGYATIMDPSKASGFGLDRFSDAEKVRVYGRRRFFGLPNLNGRDPEKLFANGGLQGQDIAHTTVVETSRSGYFNAVLFRGVPRDVFDRLKAAEEKFYLRPRQIPERALHRFQDNGTIRTDRNVIYLFEARSTLDVPRVGRVSLLRDDISPDLDYLTACREAAGVHGEVFQRSYDHTTFLADRSTTLHASGLLD